MSESQLARAGRFLLAVVMFSLLHQNSLTAPVAGAAPSLRDFFQALVEHYNPSVIPRFEDLMKAENLIPGAPPEDISQALPSIFAALSHQDERLKLYAASALVAISLRSDSAELLNGHLGAIGHLFDLADPRFQGTPILILPNLRPTPPPEVVPLLLAFLKRTDRDSVAQGSAIFALMRVAPENPQVVSAVLQFFSRPLDQNTRIGALNALRGRRVTDPHIIRVVASSLHDPDFYVRWAAFQVLTGMGPAAMQQARPALQKVTDEFLALLRRKDGDVNMQVSVLSVLLQNAPDDPRVAGAVQEFFSQPLAPVTRSAALNGLRIPNIKDPRLINLVIASLHDPNSDVRTNAAYVLKDIGPQALRLAQPELERLAQDPNQPGEVKEGAKRALQEIHPTR